ncbi:hypothetical protein NEOLEDRAFT_1127396 [Neolentinus lepideus HHB14362 ss-1]|uniref:Uncharacterized protein n=1 Tax=Neolentinus lepideus HHB14362 ss-1 TaxID=1314782 RepID=A0A165VGQ3_9AGAM|nr:hypothetical protein NEOLEDRAFT_1127396 [Neolentinus lepideus HHB14362 ss-1]
MSGPYNQSSNDPAVDRQTYNPRADTRLDNASYQGITDPELVSVSPRGADNRPTGRNPAREDRDAEQSELFGQVYKDDVEALTSELGPDERTARGRTRGVHNDAWKQVRTRDEH